MSTTTTSDDYKNGYNECVEKMIQLLNQALVNQRSGDTSINDELRLIRRHILNSSFQDQQRQQGNL